MAPDAVAVARTRARRRLIGATLLLGMGIVGFPLLFETQPRPISVDIPIDIPRKESAPALRLPAARPASAVVVAPMDPAPDIAPSMAPNLAPPAAPPAASPPAALAVPKVTESRQAAAEPGVAPARPAVVPAAPAPAKPEAPRAQPDAGQRAQALLDGKGNAAESAATESTRVVVQVGAYTDADKLREARHKVEKLGMKTYTQVIEGDGNRRTRVRVGPFATRAEAEKAAARIKATGLPAAILSL
jgi:DedD protein